MVGLPPAPAPAPATARSQEPGARSQEPGHGFPHDVVEVPVGLPTAWIDPADAGRACGRAGARLLV
jgi:hypothetical protein